MNMYVEFAFRARFRFSRDKGHLNEKGVTTVCMVTHQPGKVANSARGQLNRENEIFLVRVHA